MQDVLFRFEVAAAPASVIEALTTTAGIEAFWTTQADVPSEVGKSLTLGFAEAPAPFDLVLDESTDRAVVWRTETFPPHWVGTTVRWDVEPAGAGAMVRFRHGPFSDEDEAGMVAFTWGQIVVQLKALAETGKATPVFS
jgi:uncharacterized protein YndB with AHSA1/START domain